MKKLIIIIFVFLSSLNCFSQVGTIDSKNLLPFMFNKDSVQGWNACITSNSDLQITCIIDGLNYNKEQLYNMLLNYFVENYGDAKSVIQVQDKQIGQLVGKGLYSKFFFDKYSTPMWSHLVTYDSYHILKIDIKDNKIRVSLLASEYQIQDDSYSVMGALAGGSNSTSNTSVKKVIGLSGPFYLVSDPEGTTSMGKKTRLKIYQTQFESESKAFEHLIKRCTSTIESIKLKLKETPKSINSVNW